MDVNTVGELVAEMNISLMLVLRGSTTDGVQKGKVLHTPAKYALIDMLRTKVDGL